MKSQWRPAIMSMIVLTILTGIAYPLLVTGVARLLFAEKANGSLIYREGKAVRAGNAVLFQLFFKGNFPGFYTIFLEQLKDLPAA